MYWIYKITTSNGHISFLSRRNIGTKLGFTFWFILCKNKDGFVF